ncbi:hypothetical protein [Aquabacterium sp.]|uniref:hypothetical protein n=1 Tax=Aquabacterium sp. TaxID=1872578 RepID=UPI0035AE58E8
MAASPLLALASDAPVRIHEGQFFVAARKVLLKDRWRPIPMHTDGGYQYEGVEKHLIKRGFNEVDSCSIDSSRCIMFYKMGARCLRLDTIGEQVATMKVVQWSDECPDAPPPKAE